MQPESLGSLGFPSSLPNGEPELERVKAELNETENEKLHLQIKLENMEEERRHLLEKMRGMEEKFSQLQQQKSDTDVQYV